MKVGKSYPSLQVQRSEYSSLLFFSLQGPTAPEMNYHQNREVLQYLQVPCSQMGFTTSVKSEERASHKKEQKKQMLWGPIKKSPLLPFYNKKKYQRKSLLQIREWAFYASTTKSPQPLPSTADIANVLQVHQESNHGGA